MTKPLPKERPIWVGRPSIDVYVVIYLLTALVLMSFLDVLELYFGRVASGIIPKSLILGGISIPYPVEIITDVIILLALLSATMNLLLLRARNRYELYVDGMSINTGIINLQNTYVAPMAFSDARLIRSWLLRLAWRGLIILDTNDDRHFQLQLIENPLEVQALIRKALGHPTFRTEAEARDLTNSTLEADKNPTNKTGS